MYRNHPQGRITRTVCCGCHPDGLEREFKCFNWLEGGVCPTCAREIKENLVTANVSRLMAHAQGLNFRGQETGECLRAVSVVRKGMIENRGFDSHSLRHPLL